MLPLGSCTGRAPEPARFSADWLVGRSRPDFDPDGPQQPVRAALERLLTRSLVVEDSGGAVVGDAAERFTVSGDRLTWTFHLRWDLRFTDGTPCTSRDFIEALVAGLGRTDHGTRAWLLSAVEGMDAVRANRPLPALGIVAPDARTLVLRLTRPDPLLPRKLALTGVSAAWRRRTPSPDWKGAVGLGPYRLSSDEGSRLRLSRVAKIDGAPDTLSVRFVASAARVRGLLRDRRADLVWPLPPGLGGTPPGYRGTTRPASPRRWMWLVLRADLPPTTRLPARHAIAHAINPGELIPAIGAGARTGEPWLEGAAPFDFPNLDAGEVSAWLERGRFGKSFHVTLAYDAEGPADAGARALQGAAARLNLYYELRPQRGRQAEQAALTGNSHLLLIEAQAPLARPEAELAQLVMPLRGPAVGVFRTGWRTREFDPWIAPRRPAPAFDPLHAAERLEEELIALPVASLPWEWLEREGGPKVEFHPRFGPEFPSGHNRYPATLSH